MTCYLDQTSIRGVYEKFPRTKHVRLASWWYFADQWFKEELCSHRVRNNNTSTLDMIIYLFGGSCQDQNMSTFSIDVACFVDLF